MAKSKRKNITFELKLESFEALELDADACHAESRHQRARDIVVEYLSNGRAAEPSEAIERLESEVIYLEGLVKKLAYSVMVHAARVPSDDANQWIRQHMSRSV